MSGSQSWNFIHWDQTNPSKVYLFLDADKFVLSFLLISNKSQLCWISRLNSSQMGLRGRHSNCLSNLLKIQNWAGNTEKRIYWSKVKWRFCQILWPSQLYNLACPHAGSHRKIISWNFLEFYYYCYVLRENSQDFQNLIDDWLCLWE